jgi:hypothetical protein
LHASPALQQTPLQHVPPVQALPQAPQFAFVPSGVQAPAQKAWPLGHWQPAVVQTVPSAQLVIVPSGVQAPPQQPVP